MRPIICFYSIDEARQAVDELRQSELLADLREEKDNAGERLFVLNVDDPEELAACETVARLKPHGAVYCPSCRSLNVEFPSEPRNSPSLYAVSKVVESIAPGVKRRFYCRECHHTWS